MNATPDRELTLRDYAHVVARRKWIVVTAVVAAVAAAITLAALQTPIYQASAQMLVKHRCKALIILCVERPGRRAAAVDDQYIQRA